MILKIVSSLFLFFHNANKPLNSKNFKGFGEYYTALSIDSAY